MPSRSKSQQRLMAAAEHGATFPKARELRASMTQQQLHDFASGSMKGKPEHEHAHAHPHRQAVAAAHAHLSATVAGFRSLTPAHQFRMVQRHVKRNRG